MGWNRQPKKIHLYNSMEVIRVVTLDLWRIKTYTGQFRSKTLRMKACQKSVLDVQRVLLSNEFVMLFASFLPLAIICSNLNEVWVVFGCNLLWPEPALNRCAFWGSGDQWGIEQVESIRKLAGWDGRYRGQHDATLVYVLCSVHMFFVFGNTCFWLFIWWIFQSFKVFCLDCLTMSR